MLKSSYSQKIEAGCDEAGRGCLAGPVVAASIIMPREFENPLLNDSKKLSKKIRLKLEEVIKEKSIAWAVGEVWNTEIDKINILNASIKAMHLAIEKLRILPEYLIIDGNKFHQYKKIQHKCIVKGDAKYMSIAAASVIAKTARDKIMKDLSKEFPQYSWGTNQGYPTKKHREAIKKFGTNKYHRKSFRLLPNQLELF